MSDITANIIVEPINLNVQVEQPEITITPEVIGLNVFLGGLAVLGGNTGELQFNNAGQLGGVSNTNFSAGNLSLGSVANVKINGGNSAFYLQTDGTGNLTWAAGTGNITGNGSPGGAVNQIQYNKDGANFGGSAGFTFDPSSNAFATPGAAGVGGNLTVLQNANIVGNIIANNFVGTYANGTTTIDVPSANGNVNISVGGNPNILVVTNTSIEVFGNVTSNGGVFNGNGAGLTNLTGANVTGAVANATFATTAGSANTANLATAATTAGTVTTAAQPNITSVGNLTTLNVVGNASIGNNLTITSNAQVSGSLNIQRATEKVLIAGSTSGNVNFDIIDQSIASYTSSGNIGLNIRGNSTITLNSILDSNASLTCAALVTNGATPYIISNVSIDGSLNTVKYPIPGTVGAGTPNGVDVYTFNIIKTAANTFTVLGSVLGHI
jgi:hypothetical protein